MSEPKYSCSACAVSLPAGSFSKSQVNKLEHKKVQSIKCMVCTERAVVAQDGAPKVKVEKQQVVLENKPEKAKAKSSSYDPSLMYIKSPDKTPIIADAVEFAKSFGLGYNVKIGPTSGWRTVVKLAVRGVVRQNKNGDDYISTTMGLFKPGSHNVVSCTDSPAHHVTINKALVRIEQARRRAGVEGYIEGTGYEAGLNSDGVHKNCFLKYVLLTLARQSNKVQLSLVWNTEPTGHAAGETALAKLVSELLSPPSSGRKNVGSVPETSDLFHSVWVNYNPSSRYNNAITGRGDDAWKLFFGERYAREVVATPMENPPQLMFPPFVFRQANICAFTNIICNVRTWIQDMVDQKYTTAAKNTQDTKKRRLVQASVESESSDVRGVKCVELYAGVGTIGLNCLDLLTELNCSDENPHNLACFEAARLSMQPESVRNRAAYRSEPAGAVASSGGLRGYELILVDPPRKGLDEEVLQAMLHHDNNSTTNASSNSNHTDGKGKKRAAQSKSGSSEGVINAKRLIYVSCGFPAFKRDAARLTGTSPGASSSAIGGNDNDSVRHWKLVHMEGHVLFPGSDHIETLAIFDRL